MTLQQILEEVKNGQLSVEHAENLLKKEGYEEMDYAKLDTTRKERTGFAEVVYCARKADEHLLNIYQKLYEEDGEVFGTRASRHQYELVKSILPQAVYDPVSGILKIEKEKRTYWKNCSVYSRNCRYFRCGGSSPDSRVFRYPRGTDL